MPILEKRSFELVTHSDEQTQRIGARLGALLPSHMVVALIGPMGAGKTHFSKGVGLGWGADQALRSPTFTLVQEHHRASDRDTLYHIDLYRAERPADVLGIGLSEIFDDDHAITLVEWAERAENLLPEETLYIRIAVVSETKRQITFSTQSEQTWAIIESLKKRVFGVN